MSCKNDTAPSASERHVAIVGTGISGLSAAWLLSQTMRVTVYEADTRLGGHSNTVIVPTPNAPIPVDTGFIVYNERNYPNLVALFKHLDVETAPSEMSFSVSLGRGEFEYSGSGINGLFGQRKNIIRPRFWMMLRDISRFYKNAPALLHRHDLGGVTLGEYLDRNHYSQVFIRDHLLPMGAAIWSMTAEEMRDYPLAAFVRFFDSHGLLSIKNRPQWRTVVGGSREYVRRLSNGFSDSVRLGVGVVRIERQNGQVIVTDTTGHSETYTDVLIATHANQALALLSDPDAQEREMLGSFRYTDNKAVLHSDDSPMPYRKRLWASWNYTEGDREKEGQFPLCVTYWMNRLQNIDPKNPLFVTLNPTHAILAEKQIDSFDYTHPLFDRKALAAQQQLWWLQGQRNTWFCGAYFGYGFHEDGLQSGLAAAESLAGVRRPWNVEGESGRIVLAPSVSSVPEITCCDKKVESRTALFRGTVMHMRHRPRQYHLKYRMFSLLLDYDELPSLGKKSRIFGYNRRSLISFWDKDHGDGQAEGLRSWISGHLQTLGVLEEGMRFEILCYPRVLGYVFNPLTVYFCYTAEGVLRAILYEVCNTFRESHTYVIPVTNIENGVVRQECAKKMYVSPFVPMECTYRFQIEPPDDKSVLIRIDEFDADGLVLVASFAGKRHVFSDAELWRTFLRYPLMTFKAIIGIHWEALRIWLKGVPVHRHRAAEKPVASTVVFPKPSSEHPPS